MQIRGTESNKWLAGVITPSFSVDVYAFPSEELRNKFINDLPPGVVYATAYDDGKTPDLFAGLFKHAEELKEQ